jgi:hypothetical protein
MILGMKNEKMNNPMTKKILKESNAPQLPESMASFMVTFRVPANNVKIKVPGMMPRPVPKK